MPLTGFHEAKLTLHVAIAMKCEVGGAFTGKPGRLSSDQY